MFEIQPELAITEVDQRVSEKLAALQAHIYRNQTPPTPIQFRFAPSIILRSEAELFGLSRPRFAIRAYVGPNSLVNLRRIRAMAATIRKTYSSSHLAEKLANEYSSAISGWIADSLLVPPATAGPNNRAMKYITVDLMHAYGEPNDPTRNSSIHSVPFVTHLRVGGGMCAQAAAFMALTLAKAKRIYGPSELTRLVFPARTAIPLDGLTCDQLCNLLSIEEFGTFAVRQVVQCGQPRLLDATLRAYIGSGIPVILLVALSRLAGKHPDCVQPIIDKNDPIITSLIPAAHWDGLLAEYDLARNDHHCVVVVGMSRDSNDSNRDSLFSIQDPATLPFLTASAKQLLDARRYNGADTDGLGGIRYEIAEKPLEPYKFVEIIPVTPAGVVNVLAQRATMQALWRSTKRNPPATKSDPPPTSGLPSEDNKSVGNAEHGLLQFAESVITDNSNAFGLHVPRFVLTGDEIRLMTAAELRPARTPEKLRAVDQVPDPQSLKEWIFQRLPPNWHWMIIVSRPHSEPSCKHSVWFFSASVIQRQPNLVLVYRDGIWQERTHSKGEQ